MAPHDAKHAGCFDFFDRYGGHLLAMQRKYNLRAFPSTPKVPISIAALAKFVFPVAMANGVFGVPKKGPAASASASASFVVPIPAFVCPDRTTFVRKHAGRNDV